MITLIISLAYVKKQYNFKDLTKSPFVMYQAPVPLSLVLLKHEACSFTLINSAVSFIHLQESCQDHIR